MKVFEVPDKPFASWLMLASKMVGAWSVILSAFTGVIMLIFSIFWPVLMAKASDVMGIDALRSEVAGVRSEFASASVAMGAILSQHSAALKVQGEAQAEQGEILSAIQKHVMALEPPRVLIWGPTGQVGECNSQRCEYRLSAARTSYGDTCGTPTAISVNLFDEGEVRTDTEYRDFKPKRLGRTMSSFVVDLIIPSGMQPGRYEWRAIVTYPTCSGVGEPVPRVTDRFPLVIGALR